MVNKIKRIIDEYEHKIGNFIYKLFWRKCKYCVHLNNPELMGIKFDSHRGYCIALTMKPLPKPFGHPYILMINNKGRAMKGAYETYQDFGCNLFYKK